MRTQIEMEEEALIEDYNNGYLTIDEYHRELHDLEADYRAAAEEAAQRAYDRELEGW